MGRGRNATSGAARVLRVRAVGGRQGSAVRVGAGRAPGPGTVTLGSEGGGLAWSELRLRGVSRATMLPSGPRVVGRSPRPAASALCRSRGRPRDAVRANAQPAGPSSGLVCGDPASASSPASHRGGIGPLCPPTRKSRLRLPRPPQASGSRRALGPGCGLHVLCPFPQRPGPPLGSGVPREQRRWRVAWAGILVSRPWSRTAAVASWGPSLLPFPAAAARGG